MIINTEKIYGFLNYSRPCDEKIIEIIDKSKDAKGLTLEDAAHLLFIESVNLKEKLYDAARQIKSRIYGNRVVLFAPLYTSSECTNNCAYCGFSAANKLNDRKTLSVSEVVEEAKAIEKNGHKRILLVTGEHSKKNNSEKIADIMTEIYKSTGIRRINVNCAPMEIEEFKILKEAGIGTYQIFQETYHKDTYKKVHISGKKTDYEYRLTALDRAFEAGIDDVGIGALLGLYDYKFDILALIMHSLYLENKYGAGPHTVSIPRLRNAKGAALTNTGYMLSDEDIKKVCAVLRLTLPYTGLILSTRESSELRDELLNLGISQMSAGSKVSPGGYIEDEPKLSGQFEVTDERSINEVVKSICDAGYMPSFCTACYRSNRTGEHFMQYAKSGEISKFCECNAILTFMENILDFESSDSDYYKKYIENAIENIENEELKNITKEKLKQLTYGTRDLYF